MFNFTKLNNSIKNQNGNVFIFIMLAIGIISALTFSLTRSGQESGNSGDKAQTKIQVNKLLRTAKELEIAIQKLRIQNGTSENDISFHHILWDNDNYKHNPEQPNTNNVFSHKGGVTSFPTIPPLTDKEKAKIEFRGDFGIDGVGTSRSELTFTVENINKNFCTAINKELNIDISHKTPPKDGLGPTDGEFNGNYSSRASDNIIGDRILEMKEQRTGCIESNSGEFIFYHVLIER